MYRPTKQNKEFIHYFTSAGRCSVTSRKEGLIVHNGFLGRKIPSLWTSLPFSFVTPAFIADHDIIWYGISFWSIWVTCPCCVPPNCWCTLSLLAVRAVWKAEKSLALYKHSSTTTENISVLSPIFLSIIQMCEPLRQKLTLSQPNSWHSFCLNSKGNANLDFMILQLKKMYNKVEGLDRVYISHRDLVSLIKLIKLMSELNGWKIICFLPASECDIQILVQ